jgi:hypothetical protein
MSFFSVNYLLINWQVTYKKHFEIKTRFYKRSIARNSINKLAIYDDSIAPQTALLRWLGKAKRKYRKKFCNKNITL